jgi:hypothetical protein
MVHLAGAPGWNLMFLLDRSLSSSLPQVDFVTSSGNPLAAWSLITLDMCIAQQSSERDHKV